MEISLERFDDRSEPDDGGAHEDACVGYVYTFRDDEGRTLNFRVYDDEPRAAYVPPPEPGPRDRALLRDAARHLRERVGVTEIKVYDGASGSYKPLLPT